MELNNILFDLTGKLKLADFRSMEQFGMSEHGTMTRVVGTPYYVAPKVLLRKEYNEKTDAWSEGVIIITVTITISPISAS
ncbi:hypothetical protein L1987_32154 [Smallanthus sonchifolius]|uniref:Uncharacterized protein n=1 Tax=Smallanthus sonchifolius TaxID=185202 RepID=A0ACB9I859_9ASTR|nr:hypothetical protein L1987_32154 [Smallanthus sonchifolius]